MQTTACKTHSNNASIEVYRVQGGRSSKKSTSESHLSRVSGRIIQFRHSSEASIIPFRLPKSCLNKIGLERIAKINNTDSAYPCFMSDTFRARKFRREPTLTLWPNMCCNWKFGFFDWHGFRNTSLKTSTNPKTAHLGSLNIPSYQRKTRPRNRKVWIYTFC